MKLSITATSFLRLSSGPRGTDPYLIRTRAPTGRSRAAPRNDSPSLEREPYLAQHSVPRVATGLERALPPGHVGVDCAKSLHQRGLLRAGNEEGQVDDIASDRGENGSSLKVRKIEL